MQRTYEYRGFILDVRVEADFKVPKPGNPAAPIGYIALVNILHDTGVGTEAGNATAPAGAPLRLGDSAGRPFASDVDALMGGYSAARQLVDDLFAHGAG